LGRGIFSPELIELAGGIISRYCDLDGKATVDIVYQKIPQQEQNRLKATPIREDRLLIFRI